MIIVTGATGQLGRLVIQALLESTPASGIVAAVRSPEKAADLAALGVVVRQADYTRPDTLDAALAGGTKLLLISSSEVGQRVPQHQAVIAAAQRAGVQLIAYTSVLRADSSALGLAEEHRQTEALIKSSGIPYVLLRNGWYTENYAASSPMAVAHGALLGSAGEGRISSASRADYAAAAAHVLTHPVQAGTVYELAGDSSYSLAELAAEIARQSGKPVAYTNLPQADYAQMLVGVGLPQGLASLLADSDAAASRGALFDDGKQLSALIGRPTTPMSHTVGAFIGA
jgi:NAD(P)H dehydrogenase (quinone)